MDENNPDLTLLKLTEDAPVYLTSITLDAVTLDEESRKPWQGDYTPNIAYRSWSTLPK